MFTNRLLLTGAINLALVTGGAALAAPIPLYENFGTTTNSPQIDAVAFANYGDFTVFGQLPFETQNTLYYTNRGTMNAAVGFRFNHAPEFGIRQPALNFFNANSGTISSFGFTFIIIGGGGFNFPTPGPYLFISATNVVNRGLLQLDNSGVLRIEGSSVDLARSGLHIQPINNQFCSGFVTETNFFPDSGLFDNYWGVRIDGMNPGSTTDAASVLQILGTTIFAQSSPHRVTNVNFGFTTSIGVSGPATWVYTNAVTPTNIIVQGVFVGSNDTNLLLSAKFFPSSQPTNFFNSVAIQFASTETNVVLGSSQLSTVYFVDRMASETNYNILTNLNTTITFRPAAFELTRCAPFEYLAGFDSNSVVVPTLYYDPSFSNRFVTNIYSAYSASVSFLPAQLPAVPNVNITNLPGRIEIVADQLNLERTRIRGEGSVAIRTKDLVTSSNAAVDVPNLLFDLASLKGDLRVKNLSKSSVQRLAGSLAAWSAVWTNFTGFTETNVVPDPMDPMLMVTNVVTNLVEIGFHMLIVDSALITRQPVQVHTFAARSKNTVISDVINATESLFVDSERLTIDGALVLGPLINDWNAGRFPNLKYLTNLGVISIPGAGLFGGDSPQPYVNIVNRGTNVAAGHFYRTEFFENTGEIVSGQAFQFNDEFFVFPGPGGIRLETGIGVMEGGSFQAGGDIDLTGQNLKFRDYTIAAGAGLRFNVSGSLNDSGEGANNSFTAGDGFHLLAKPALGDLLGTTLETSVPRFVAASHTWAADDRGADPAGYKDNVAIGRLIIDAGVDALLTFSGRGARNGLYVDFLELGPGIMSDMTNRMVIDPNLTIYFADANRLAEELDGQMGGRLRWVKDFAGPNSSVDVVLPDGRIIKVNRALRFSPSIDSDGDGIANREDLTPFGGDLFASISGSPNSPNTVQISWPGEPGLVYQVEYTTTLSDPSWQTLLNYTNTAASKGTITIEDVVPAGSRQRFYRVRYTR